MAKITCYFGTYSPWACLAGNRLVETGARFWGQDRLDFLDEALAAL